MGTSHKLSILYALLLFAPAVISQTARQSGTEPQQYSQSADSQALCRRLLLSGYQQSKQFVPEERIIYLAMASRVASHVDPQIARSWSEELFKVAQQAPISWNRVAAEKNAAINLASFDPARAMQMLQQMDVELPTNGGVPPEDLHADAARAIYPAVWAKMGPSSLGQIRASADRIGDHGEYPYAAVAPLIKELAGKDSGASRSLFLEAVSYYKRGSNVASANYDFVNFMLNLDGAVPGPLLSEGIAAATQQLKPSKTDKSKYLSRVRTENGVAEFHDRTDELAFQLLPLARKTDPSLEQALLKDHPALVSVASQAGTVEVQEGVVVTGAALQGDVSAAQARGLQRSRLAAIQTTAETDPAKALSLAMDLTDPGAQSVGLSQVASGFASSDSAKAESLLKQAKALAEKLPDDDPMKLSALGSLAKAAASMHDEALLASALGKLFTLGEEEFVEDAQANPNKTAMLLAGFTPLTQAAQAAAKFASGSTLDAIETVRDSRLKAYLLVAAAQGIENRAAAGKG